MDINSELRSSYEESKRIIREAQKNNQLVLFVGAGASIDSGMPSWGQAIEEIKKHLQIENETDLLKIPQYYFNQRGKNEYVTLMRDIFKYNSSLSPNIIHKQILRFNSSTIITTNYDCLIEQAAEDNGEVMQVISSDKDLPYRKAGKELIKMHGDFEHDNFVLKEEDYLQYSTNFKLISNYVKSIIGSKVVLFIGYSFNDPDIRQIFEWVKDILKEDIQRAYLINADSDYDRNKEEDYKRLGVNVIFSKVLNETKTQDNPNTIVNLDDIGKHLYDTLNWLLDSCNSNSIDSIYNTLKEFKGLNYVYENYIAPAFYKHNILLSNNDYLFAEDDMAQKLLIDQIFNKDNQTENVEEIKNILIHSRVAGYAWKDKEGKQQRRDIEHPAVPEWIKSFVEFDTDNLRKIRANNEILLDENTPQQYLVQASISYYLDEYITSYNYLKQASKLLYKHHMYAYYFVAEVNRKFVGQLALSQIYISDDYNEAQFNQVKDEIENIDLDRTLMSLPDLGNQNQFLNDISSFNMSQTLFQSLYEKNIRSETEGKTNYNLYTGTPAYEEMREYIEEFFRYETANYLLLNKTRQTISVYQLYIRSILLSISLPDMKDKNENDSLLSEILSSQNIHADSLHKMDLYYILTYFSSAKSIEKLFSNFSIRSIKLDDEGMNYLETVISNITKNSITKNRSELFWKLVSLSGYVQLNSKVVDLILDYMSEKAQLNFQDFCDYQNIIVQFLINSKAQKVIKKEHRKYLKDLLNSALISIQKGKSASYEGLVKTLGSYLKGLKNQYNQISILKKLKESNLHEPLFDLYYFCGSENKRRIKDLYKDYIFNGGVGDLELYCNLVINNIINPSKELEDEVQRFIENYKIQMGMIINPDPKEELIRLLSMLIVNNKVLDEKAAKDCIKRFGSEEQKWSIDPENYDYKKFKLPWLRKYNHNFIQLVVTYKRAKENIKQLFKEAYKSKELDDSLLNIYFDYFSN